MYNDKQNKLIEQTYISHQLDITGNLHLLPTIDINTAATSMVESPPPLALENTTAAVEASPFDGSSGGGGGGGCDR